jgi:DNA-binding PadR family transcriptional regulator
MVGESERWVSWLKGGSPWKGPLLALLLERPGHPYDFANRLVHRVGPAWRLDTNDAGRVLRRAEELGLASSDVVESKRSHHRVRMYQPTELTSKAVEYWMSSPVPAEPVRAELWTRMVVSAPEHAPALLEALDHFERQLFELLKEHSMPFPTKTWKGLELELARRGVVMRVEGDLAWIELARGHILEFTGALRAPA